MWIGASGTTNPSKQIKTNQTIGTTIHPNQWLISPQFLGLWDPFPTAFLCMAKKMGVLSTNHLRYVLEAHPPRWNLRTKIIKGSKMPRDLHFIIPWPPMVWRLSWVIPFIPWPWLWWKKLVTLPGSTNIAVAGKWRPRIEDVWTGPY